MYSLVGDTTFSINSNALICNSGSFVSLQIVVSIFNSLAIVCDESEEEEVVEVPLSDEEIARSSIFDCLLPFEGKVANKQKRREKYLITLVA